MTQRVTIVQPTPIWLTVIGIFLVAAGAWIAIGGLIVAAICWQFVCRFPGLTFKLACLAAVIAAFRFYPIVMTVISVTVAVLWWIVRQANAAAAPAVIADARDNEP